MSLIRKVQNP